MYPIRSLPIIVTFITVGTLILFGVNVRAQTEPPVEISVAPEINQVAAGETVEIAIAIAEARELYAFDIGLSFDPAVMEMVDADPNQDGVQVAMGTFFEPGFVLRNLVDNEAGTIRFAMTQLNPSEAKSGEGILIIIKAKGKTAGSSSPLTIAKGEVAQRTGVKPPTSLNSGVVQVVITPATGPTATPIPTQAVGTAIPTNTPAVAVDTPVATATAVPATPTSPPDPPTATHTPITQDPTPTATQSPPTEPPPTFTPTEPPPEPTATPLATIAPPTATSEPVPADNTVVVQVTTPTVAIDSPVPETPGSGATPIKAVEVVNFGEDWSEAEEGPNQSYLFIGAGLLLVALALVLGAIVIWRRSTPQ